MMKQRLPRFEDNQALEWAGEQIIEHNADIQALVQELWGQKVKECGEEYVRGPADIVEVFQAVIDLRDPDHTSGVTVKLVENKTALSWESPEMAVVVGGKRAPIKTSDELFPQGATRIWSAWTAFNQWAKDKATSPRDGFVHGYSATRLPDL